MIERPDLGYKKHEGKLLKKGYTTGSCAAGAAKAATMMLLKQSQIDKVEINTPANVVLNLDVTATEVGLHKAGCFIIKDGGDDPDITNGAKVCATVRFINSGIEVKAGKGVGKVTKPGLAVSPGKPAINPTPMKMIIDSVAEVLPPNIGVEVTIEIPEGEELAKKTLNPELGIIGGISVLGTTGIVEPMSEDAFKTSLVQGIDVLVAQGHKAAVFTPGKTGQKSCQYKLGINPELVVQTSNFIGYMLEEAKSQQIDNVLLVGHIGKLVKLAAGVFNTHNRVADARREVIALQVALSTGNIMLAKDIMKANTAEEIIYIIKEHNLDYIFNNLAEIASDKAIKHVKGDMNIGIVFLDLQGNVIGYDKKAIAIGERIGWTKQLP